MLAVKMTTSNCGMPSSKTWVLRSELVQRKKTKIAYNTIYSNVVGSKTVGLMRAARLVCLWKPPQA